MLSASASWYRSGLLLAAVSTAVFCGPSQGRAGGDEPVHPNVVVSIKPLYSLVAGVMAGIETPFLLLSGPPDEVGALDRDQTRRIRQADVVVWIGPQLESFVERAIISSGRQIASLALIDAPGVRLMDLGISRDDAVRDADRGATDETRRRVSRGAVRPRHPDPRIWLSPRNAMAMTRAIADVLAAIDPRRTARYRRNASRLTAALEAIDGQIETIVGPVRERAYIGIGNGLQYFERSYALRSRARILPPSERQYDGEEIEAWRRFVADEGIRCIIRPRGAGDALLERILHGAAVRVQSVDIYGSEIVSGRNSYFVMMRRIAFGISECLDPVAR